VLICPDYLTGIPGGFLIKPLIGITSNTADDDRIGLITRQGAKKQEWQLLADDYIKSVERAGGIPLIIPVVKKLSSIARVLDLLDGIIFSGGVDIDPYYYGEPPGYGLGRIEPERDRHEIELGQKVLYEMEIPVMGICRGIQLLNIVAGGSVYQDIRLDREHSFNHGMLDIAPKDYLAHEVSIKPGSLLHSIFKAERIRVNSFNHQAVKELGKGFEVSMEAEDGLIEGIEMAGERFVSAVQWHPEMLIDKYAYYLRFFEAFIEASARYRQQQG